MTILTWIVGTGIIITIGILIMGGLYILGLREIYQSKRSIFNKKTRDKIARKVK